uniref:Uncharacterized protein n=1 Tax=Phenylobacterium glaciei TaxID=2803784 RepID=A0A974P5U9_9CAUL|nr:hypothetical protein JKL49_06925 [Phenylobacterium glaciei]
MTPNGRSGAPIGLQLVALLLVSLVAAQVMTFAVVVLMPPPPQAVYRLEDVAQALKGGSLTPRFGRPWCAKCFPRRRPSPPIRPPRARTPVGSWRSCYRSLRTMSG